MLASRSAIKVATAAMRAVGTACLALLVVSCGGGGPTAEEWAGRVCGALTPWRTEISQLNAEAQREISGAGTAAATQASLLELLSGAEEASRTALAEVTAAGVPDVAGGAEVARTFAISLGQTGDAYALASQELAALPTEDETAFYDGVAAVLSRLNAAYIRSGVEAAQAQSPELSAAFDGSPQCQ